MMEIVVPWLVAGVAGFILVGLIAGMFDGSGLLWSDVIAFVIFTTLGPATLCAGIVFGLLIVLDHVIPKSIQDRPVFGPGKDRHHGY